MANGTKYCVDENQEVVVVAEPEHGVPEDLQEMLEDAKDHLDYLETELEECTTQDEDNGTYDEILKAISNVNDEIAGIEIRLAHET